MARAGAAGNALEPAVVTVLDPRYVAARHVLLDALVALEPHADALIIAGAQAVYLHTGDGDLAVAPFTTDADLAMNPRLLSPNPLIEAAMAGGGFSPALNDGNPEPGIWTVAIDIDGDTLVVSVDLIVPEAVAQPGGRRGARLGPPGRQGCRRCPATDADDRSVDRGRDFGRARRASDGGSGHCRNGRSRHEARDTGRPSAGDLHRVHRRPGCGCAPVTPPSGDGGVDVTADRPSRRLDVRGEAVATSDVDLLVDLEAGRTRLDLAARRRETQVILGTPVDVATPDILKQRVR